MVLAGRGGPGKLKGRFRRLQLEKRLEAGAKGIPGCVLSKCCWREISGARARCFKPFSTASCSPPGNPPGPSAQPDKGLPSLLSLPSAILVETTSSSYLNVRARSPCPSASASHPFHSLHQTWADLLAAPPTTSPLAR